MLLCNRRIRTGIIVILTGTNTNKKTSFDVSDPGTLKGRDYICGVAWPKHKGGHNCNTNKQRKIGWSGGQRKNKRKGREVGGREGGREERRKRMTVGQVRAVGQKGKKEEDRGQGAFMIWGVRSMETRGVFRARRRQGKRTMNYKGQDG